MKTKKQKKKLQSCFTVTQCHVDPVGSGGILSPFGSGVTDVRNERAASDFRVEVGRNPLPIKFDMAQSHTVKKPPNPRSF